MELLITGILIALGTLLFITEVLFIPGISIAPRCDYTIRLISLPTRIAHTFTHITTNLTPSICRLYIS